MMETTGELAVNPRALIQKSYAKDAEFDNMRDYLLAKVESGDFNPDATTVGVSLPDESVVFCLNAVASFVFEAVCLRKDVDEICCELEQLFEVDPEELRQDVLGILEDFKEQHLLV